MVATLKRSDALLDPAAEAVAARLTRAAYDVALRHGIKGSFTDLELALWREMRAVVGMCRGSVEQESAAQLA